MGDVRNKLRGGALSGAAKAVRDAGRFGDTHVVHINARELRRMREAWGEPTINPETGLPEFFDFGGILGAISSVVSPIGQIVSAAAPFLSMIPGLGGPMAQGAGALGSMLGGPPVPGQQQPGVRNQQTGKYEMSPAAPRSAGGGLGAFLGPLAQNAIPAALITAIDYLSQPDVPSVAEQMREIQNAVAKNTPGWNDPLPKATFSQEGNFPAEQDWSSYGSGPGVDFFTGSDNPELEGKARGGVAQMRDAGRMYHGPGGGQDDKIPAMLSDGEYVIDATTVADLGDGNPDVGAQRLDQFRNAISRHKGRREKVPPKAHANIEAYLGGRS